MSTVLLVWFFLPTEPHVIFKLNKIRSVFLLNPSLLRQTADLLSYGGLSNVYKLIVSHENDKEAVPLSTIPALDRTTVVQAFQQFDQVASSPDQSMLQQVRSSNNRFSLAQKSVINKCYYTVAA